jgi:hypothetical protein
VGIVHHTLGGEDGAHRDDDAASHEHTADYQHQLNLILQILYYHIFLI